MPVIFTKNRTGVPTSSGSVVDYNAQVAVADMNGDRKPDLISNEQEELLPAGRENPRWIVWENLGGLKFREHIILDRKLGGHELQVGDVGRDGDIDICSKPSGPRAWNGHGGKMHVDFLENLQKR